MQILPQPIPQAGLLTMPQHALLGAHRRRHSQNQQQLQHHVLLLQTPAQDPQRGLQRERARARPHPVREPLHRRRKASQGRNGEAQHAAHQSVPRVREERARDRALQSGVLRQHPQQNRDPTRAAQAQNRQSSREDARRDERVREPLQAEADRLQNRQSNDQQRSAQQNEALLGQPLPQPAFRFEQSGAAQSGDGRQDHQIPGQAERL